MKLHEVVATDENGRDFAAFTLHPDPPAEAKVPVWVFIDGQNGWNEPPGHVALLQLKRLGDGKFGA